MISHVDGKFGKYWIKAKQGAARLKVVVQRMGVSRSDALGGEVGRDVLSTLQDRKSLRSTMLKVGVRSFGVFGTVPIGGQADNVRESVGLRGNGPVHGSI